MNFVTMGDSHYFRTLLLSAQQASHFYPEGRFLLYDWGLEQEQTKQLSELANVKIVDWQSRIPSGRRLVSHDTGLRRFVKRTLIRSPGTRRTESSWQRELSLNEKVFSLLHAAHTIDGAFLFLDADAFLVNRIDELNDLECDVVTTLRPLGEIESARKRGSRHDINSGVILFGPHKENALTFITEWLKEMMMLSILGHPLAEQTSLSNMILRGDPCAFSRQEGTVHISVGRSRRIRCGYVDGQKYNYAPTSANFDPDHNKIVHLKSGRHSSSFLQAIISETISRTG